MLFIKCVSPFNKYCPAGGISPQGHQMRYEIKYRLQRTLGYKKFQWILSSQLDMVMSRVGN